MGVGIQVEALNAWYGKTQSLYDINLHMQANHATALIGPSGCGKSTFIRCLNRMHETIPEARARARYSLGTSMLITERPPTQHPTPRRHGLSEAKSLSHHVDLRQRRVGLKLNGFRNRSSLDETVERSLKRPRSGKKSKTTCTRNPAPASPADSSSVCASRARSPSSRRFC